MRTAFQLLVFAAYVAALAWGGWYVLSNYVLPERDATSDVEESVTPALEETVATVTLARTGETAWTLAYELTSAVDGLDFGRPIGDSRAATWVAPEGFTLTVGEENEHLICDDGNPFTSVTLHLRTDDRIMPKEYVPFNVFSDGGVSVYTGHLLADALMSDEGDLRPSQMRFRLRYVPLSGEAVIAEGLRSSETLEADMTAATSRPRAFVYFGSATTVETPSLIAVIDPATPAWLTERLNGFLPEIFDHYSTVFDRRPAERPMVLVGARFDVETEGYSVKGGALDHQIQLRLRGDRLQDYNTGFDNYFVKFLSHEGAHLWQSVVEFSSEDAWIHEGGADALALNAVAALDVWSAEQIAAAEDKALQDCAAGPGSFPLDEADRNGAFDLYYSCGMLIALVTERGLQGVNNELDIADFWKVLTESAPEDNTLSRNGYIATALSMGIDPEIAAAIEKFVTTPHDDTKKGVETLLASAAMRIAQSEDGTLHMEQ